MAGCGGRSPLDQAISSTTGSGGRSGPLAGASSSDDANRYGGSMNPGSDSAADSGLSDARDIPERDTAANREVGRQLDATSGSAPDAGPSDRTDAAEASGRDGRTGDRLSGAPDIPKREANSEAGRPPDSVADSARDAGQSDSYDAADASERGVLKLVAGGLGGSGDQDGVGTAARFSTPWGVASDGAGNLFVTDWDNRTIRKIVLSTGVVTTLAGHAWTAQDNSLDGVGTSAQLRAPMGMASDGLGNLFVADAVDTIRKIVIATGVVTTLAGSPGKSGNVDGTAATAQFGRIFDVASDGAGNVFVPDMDNHTIRKISVATGMVTTLAGSAGNPGWVDGTGSAALFNYPSRVAADRAGNLFVGEEGNSAIREIVIATGVVTTVAGALGQADSQDGIGVDAHFLPPTGMACDGAGNLFFADAGNDNVRRIIIATREVTTLAGSRSNYGSEDGVGADASFEEPTGITDDGAGNLFVADLSNHVIRKIVVATRAVTTLAGSADRAGRTDGTAAAARFNDPGAMASGGTGDLFVADTYNDAIRRVVIATGAVTTLVGPAGATDADTGGGPLSPLYRPIALASDGEGNLFVSEITGCRIRRIAIATGAVTTFVGKSCGNADGRGDAAQLARVTDLTTDGAGNLFVVDSSNYAIRKVVIATADVTTVVGPADLCGSDDISSISLSCWPRGAAVDGQGNLFVTDTSGYTIRKIVIATGTATILAGSPGKSGHVDGTGTDARFDAPAAIASDGAGNLFVADSSTVRRIVVASQAVSTVVGLPGHSGMELGPLPGRLSAPAGLVFAPPGDLFISDQNAVLVAQF